MRADVSAAQAVNFMNGAGLFFMLSQRLMAHLAGRGEAFDQDEEEMNRLSDLVADFLFNGLGGPGAARPG